MTTLREAAQMALEALESKYIVNCGAWRVQQDQAITALRAALAEPEQEPVAWISEGGDVSRSKRYMDEMGFKCEPLYAAPTPRKPVAVVTRKTGNPGITMSWWHEPALPVGTSLYTAPISQSKPLTDEKIKDILLGIDPDTKRLPPGFRDFARAIEKAHGIGDSNGS